MIAVAFTVNDEAARNEFLAERVFAALGELGADTVPCWGRMTPQQMVEHLLWAVEVSTGAVTVECRVPPKLTERFRTFLYNDSPTSHDFMNPVLKQGLPPLRYGSIPEAVSALRAQTTVFLRSGNGPEPRVHPVFGPLDHEQWTRSHFKHFYHHLLQFGMIESA